MALHGPSGGDVLFVPAASVRRGPSLLPVVIREPTNARRNLSLSPRVTMQGAFARDDRSEAADLCARHQMMLRAYGFLISSLRHVDGGMCMDVWRL